MTATYEQALESLRLVDPAYPVPRVVGVLTAPENRHLLDYVTDDPFGAHVFPGNIAGYRPDDFLADLNTQLASSMPIHLWCYIPTCSYRCRFCQYPVVLVKGQPDAVRRKAARWADLNVREARLWLKKVPNLASVPIGEFNVFGGTPSLLPPEAIAKLLGFYRRNFNFTPDTTVRFEGDPTERGQDECRCQRAEPALQLRQRVPAPPGLLAQAADEGDEQEHAHQADGRRPAKPPEIRYGGQGLPGHAHRDQPDGEEGDRAPCAGRTCASVAAMTVPLFQSLTSRSHRPGC